ncbi:MAG: ligase-associated DNA damage response endonuclease PdeM [Ignavibacteriae bacterium]|nr:MAG: ligase-associated DNA damage response endonuclease PdeM [Ignavibacteriota bacterium]
MQGSIEFKIFNEELTLLPQRAVYIAKHKTLLASDLHLGKSGHFRNAGIAVPSQLANTDLDILTSILNELEVEKLIVLGDLFHAKMNSDWRFFDKWRKDNLQLQIELVKGNHDILNDEHYTDLNVAIHDEFCVFNKFLLTHAPPEIDALQNEACNYTISGHVHPAVRLLGKGKQSVTLPCFYFGEKYALLPAFGRFTGKAIIPVSGKDKVFVIVETEGEEKVLPVK